MTLRTAIRSHTLILFGVLLFGGWLVLSAMSVFSTLNTTSAFNNYVGHAIFSGAIGLLVMLVLGALLVTLLSELTEPDPLPEPFPPRE